MRYVCASFLAVIFTGLGALVVAAVCGLMLQIVMPGWMFDVPFGHARACEAMPLTILFLLIVFPWWVPAAMIVGAVTQAVPDRSKLHVLRVFIVCAVIVILAIVVFAGLEVAHAHKAIGVMSP